MELSARCELRGYCTFVHLSKATVKPGALQNIKDCKDFQIKKNANIKWNDDDRTFLFYNVVIYHGFALQVCISLFIYCSFLSSGQTPITG